jgi:uncharacterized protein Smg (DUF494 family)
MSNEDFWQRKIERITAERDELADNLRDMGAHAEQLRNTLQTLCDLQNGAPLLRDEAEWQATMTEARRLLKTQEDGR